MLFQSTLPVGGATYDSVHQSQGSFISIHAPRGGSDSWAVWAVFTTSYFNPRSPWGERQIRLFTISTFVHFNPRSPWGERRRRNFLKIIVKEFQSTLPVGGATLRMPLRPTATLFQSTLPVGGATRVVWPQFLHDRISIHAPRGGSDLLPGYQPLLHPYFNPRSPWGERLQNPKIRII